MFELHLYIIALKFISIFCLFLNPKKPMIIFIATKQCCHQPLAILHQKHGFFPN